MRTRWQYTVEGNNTSLAAQSQEVRTSRPSQVQLPTRRPDLLLLPCPSRLMWGTRYLDQWQRNAMLQRHHGIEGPPGSLNGVAPPVGDVDLPIGHDPLPICWRMAAEPALPRAFLHGGMQDPMLPLMGLVHFLFRKCIIPLASREGFPEAPAKPEAEPHRILSFGLLDRRLDLVRW